MDVKKTTETEVIDSGRRNALARLGLAAAVAYAVPTLAPLTAKASSSDGGSGGGGDSGGGSGGDSGGGSSSDSGSSESGGATTPTQPTTPTTPSDSSESGTTTVLPPPT